MRLIKLRSIFSLDIYRNHTKPYVIMVYCSLLDGFLGGEGYGQLWNTYIILYTQDGARNKKQCSALLLVVSVVVDVKKLLYNSISIIVRYLNTIAIRASSIKNKRSRLFYYYWIMVNH